MVKTIVLLLFTLIVVPVFTVYFDQNSMNPEQLNLLMQSGGIALALALAAFIVSTITGNCSQVDKMWSIVPAIYAWHIVANADFVPESAQPRLILMALLVTVWAVRLSYNFSRRGGFTWKFWTGEEDYRWEVLRKRPELGGKWQWMAFNLFFISLYQMGLIWLFTMPIMVAATGSNSLGWIDYAAVFVVIFLIIIETVADQQQWDYQQEKHRLKKEGQTLIGKYAKGFTHTGLWRISRHPNYFAEQSIWVVFYFFSVAATDRWLNWSVAGALLLVILFKGSADFSEGISLEKYPDYKDYVKSTPRFIPNPFKK